jgi:hypothetical protein
MCPPREPKVILEWLKTQTGSLVDPKSVKYQKRCCFCWRGEPFSVGADHVAAGCPLLATFNKVRAHQNLRPITVTRNMIDSAAKKEPITADKLKSKMDRELKEMRELVSSLDKRVKVLEGERGKKRKSSAAISPPPPQRKNSDTQDGGRKGRTSSRSSVRPADSSKAGAAESDKKKGKSKA